MTGYAELHAVSNFTFLRGASHPEELVETAAALGYGVLEELRRTEVVVNGKKRRLLDEVVARNEQYLKNIDEAVARNQATDASLDQVYQHLVQAKSLAVEGANDASVPLSGSFQALADVVEK